MSTVPEIMVTLANGTQVPWSEFRLWDGRKKHANLFPPSQTAEGRARISAARTGTYHGELTEEGWNKIVAANKGRTISEEHRARISAAMKQRHAIRRGIEK
jgi:hypothetical protein